MLSFACMLLSPLSLSASTAFMSLAGDWKYRLDEECAGLTESRLSNRFDSTLILPGSLNTNGIGKKVDVNTLWTGRMWNEDWYKSDFYAEYRKPDNLKVVFWLTPDYYYQGGLWLQKEVDIPDEWAGKPVELFLERCHWKTVAWIDGKEVGSQNSLATPHRYNLGRLSAGHHTVTLLVDNRITDINPGLDAHCISDNTQSNWNGLIGRIGLKLCREADVKRVAVYPLFEEKKIRVRLSIENYGSTVDGQLSLKAVPKEAGSKPLPEFRKTVSLNEGVNDVEIVYDMASDFRLWDEFSPNVYELQTRLSTAGGTAVVHTDFGLRNLTVEGTQIAVNGRRVFLRGTLDCCVFPLTGFPPVEAEAWERIMLQCKKYGLNHIRFHSWCPPDVAFEVADRLGLYLYVETAGWGLIGDGTPIDSFIMDESVRIVDEYGNHPSFCFFSYGNEPKGDSHKKYLTDFVEYWKSRDSRFLYTSSAGWPALPVSDFVITQPPRIQGWGQELKSVINANVPSTSYDWSDKISRTHPTVSHEIGQWCAFPDLKERSCYTGVFKAKNYDIFENRLRNNGLLQLADSFLLASGKLQTLCYKADIEAALRTKGFAGFQLLGLNDFPGQGTSPVGVLNAFWKEKGYVTAGEYREFCNRVVPLARMDRLVFNSGDTLVANVQVAQFAATSMTVPVRWSVTAEDGIVVASGEFGVCDIPTGGLSDIGKICARLAVDKPSQLRLAVEAGEYVNHWNLWVYPEVGIECGDILVADALTSQVKRQLERGKKVLLAPKFGTLRNEGTDSVVVGFSSVFWNTLWTNGQAPHTLGLLCEPEHPALRLFPTEYHSDYQWHDIVSHCNAIPLRKLGNMKPVVRIIDNWFTSRSFGLIVEMRVGKGSLLLCGADLLDGIERRPEARQLLASLLAYMQTEDFRPGFMATYNDLQQLFVD